MASVVGSSDEKINGIKLMRLIVDLGTEALRKSFTAQHPGIDLQVVLNLSQPTLSRLKRQKIINQNQWDILYPVPPSLANIYDFDITLLSVLLRNICSLSPPCSGWDTMPNVSDHSIEADIVRIKLFRNERFGHIPSTSVSAADFETLWAEINSPLLHLGIQQGDIDRLADSIDILNRHLLWCDFQSEIKIYYEKFTKGSREWVFEQFSRWFNDETSKNRAFVISGLAGMGKSVIAAAICKMFAEHIGACHFFQCSNSQYNNPNILLQSLAWHLSSIIPAYKENLVTKLSGKLGQCLNDMNVEGLFSAVLKEPFSDVADPGRRILIVLYAVDESDQSGRQELASLISRHLHKLPSYIRFLITTRPEKNLIDKFNKLNPLYIERDDERNLSDLKLVLMDRISTANVLTEDLLNKLAAKSDGLMLYAFFLSEVYNDESSVFCIDSLPEGIDGYYESYFKRLECELSRLQISEDKFFSLLSALAVARDPLPVAFVKTLFDFENLPRTMQKVRKALSSLLIITEDKCISFFHKSVRDWLVDNSELDYSVDVQCGHQILSDLCTKNLDKLKQVGVKDVTKIDTAVKYSIKYYIPHMLGAPEEPGKQEDFISNYVVDLQILFASVCVDLYLTLNNLASLINRTTTTATVKELFSLIKRFAFLLRGHPQSFLQTVVNEGGKELSSKASSLLETQYKHIIYLELLKKSEKNDPLETRCLLSGTISGIDISPNHGYVVCAYREGGIEFFSLATGMSEWKIHNLTVERPCFSLPSNYLRAPCMLPHCIVFHPRANLILPGTLHDALNFQGKPETGPFQCGEDCSAFTNCCFSSDNNKMATNYKDNLIVWNVSSGSKERFFQCKTLFSLSFTASGNFLGTVDVENVLTVYDVTNNYSFKHVRFLSQFPMEIFFPFGQNSWICSIQQVVTIVNHDFSSAPCHRDIVDLILPSDFHYPCELQSFFQDPKHSWFSKVKILLNKGFFWSCFTALRFFLVGDKSVLIYSRSSNVMHVFSIEGLEDVEEQAFSPKGVFSNISTNGDLAYFSNTWTQHITIFKTDSDSKDSKLCRNSKQLCVPVVRDGVILYGDDDNTPELWNSELTECLARFDDLAGARECVQVSDELIACVYQSYVTFFNVFTRKIVSKTIITDDVLLSLRACSSKCYVLAQVESSGLSLWKNEKKVDGWEDVFSSSTSLRGIVSPTFSPQGNRLALSSVETNKVFIFDVVSIEFLAQVTIYGPHNDLLRLSFFDNENLVCSSTNHMLYFINAKRGEILTCLDLGNIPAPIAVCRKRSIVFVGLDCKERYELMKVWLPRN